MTELRCVAGLREAEEKLVREVRRTKAREGVERSRSIKSLLLCSAG